MTTLPTPAERLHRTALNPFAALNQKLQAMTAAGQNVIRLDIGSPDLPPPAAVIEALAQSAADPTHHGYMSYRGDPVYRRAVAAYYERRFGVTLNPDTEILPLIGSKEGLANISLAYLDRGDAAILPELSYPTYAAGAFLAGGDTLTIPMRAEENYLLNFDEPIAGIERAKLLWVNYPNNPTGAVASLDFYARALAFCRDHNLLLCSDNPYVDVTYDGYRAPSVMQIPDAKAQAVEFVSLSKSHNMAGWRLGACVGNTEALNKLLVVKSTIDTAQFRAIYDAGTVALNTVPESWIAERNERYAARRETLLAALPDLGLTAERPRATLYVWARITDGRTDREYAASALAETCVSITPGSTYGAAGDHYLRFSLGVSDARFTEALDRLREWYAHAVHARA
jgi:LL-diaminopimelate aminotransferase